MVIVDVNPSYSAEIDPMQKVLIVTRSVSPRMKLPLNCQTIGIFFKNLPEAVGELLQPMNMHSSPFVLHFIIYWSLLWRNNFQIVR